MADNQITQSTPRLKPLSEQSGTSEKLQDKSAETIGSDLKPSNDPKKRGPKPGSHNVPKVGAVPQPRKAAGGIVDKKQAAERRLSEARQLLQDYDKDHNTGMAGGLPTWEQIQAGKAIERKPQIDAGTAAAMLGIIFNLAGEMMEVEARPDPASLKNAGASIEELSKHLPVMSPLATAASAVVVSVGLCAMPMVLEYKAVKSGEIPSLKDRGAVKNGNA